MLVDFERAEIHVSMLGTLVPNRRRYLLEKFKDYIESGGCWQGDCRQEGYLEFCVIIFVFQFLDRVAELAQAEPEDN